MKEPGKALRIVINTVFLTSETYGGSWSYTFNLLRALRVTQTEFDLVVLANQATADIFRKIGVEVVLVNLPSGARFARVAWEQIFLSDLVAKYSPSVIHSTGNVLPARLRCPSVVTLHDLQYLFFPKNFSFARRTYLRYAVPASLRRASKIICVSDLTRKHANEQLDVSNEKLVVIHEGGLWRNEPETINSNEAVLERLGIERPFLLSAGSSMPHKNLPALIRAFALVARHIPHKLVIAGEPFSFSSDIFVALGCIGETRGRINVTGFIPREELLSLYRCADAFIFPSLFEGFGIPAVEAMESGCPVVSSNATSLPEVLGDAAEFFDPLSVESIAEAIKRVCLSKDLQNDLRQRGHERAKEFSWEKMARRTMEVYYSLA